MNFKETFKNIDKKSLMALGAIILVTVIVFVGLLYFLSKDQQVSVQELPKNTMKEAIRSLTAPNLGKPISEETQDGLSTSSELDLLENKEEILNNLTAPN